MLLLTAAIQVLLSSWLYFFYLISKFSHICGWTFELILVSGDFILEFFDLGFMFFISLCHFVFHQPQAVNMQTLKNLFKCLFVHEFWCSSHILYDNDFCFLEERTLTSLVQYCQGCLAIHQVYHDIDHDLALPAHMSITTTNALCVFCEPLTSDRVAWGAPLVHRFMRHVTIRLHHTWYVASYLARTRMIHLLLFLTLSIFHRAVEAVSIIKWLQVVVILSEGGRWMLTRCVFL